MKTQMQHFEFSCNISLSQLFSRQLQTELSALTQTPGANQGQLWCFLGFGVFLHFRRNYLQFANHIFRVSLNATSLEFFPWDQKTFYLVCFADDQNCSEVSKNSKHLSSEFLAYLTLLPKPRQCCCHFYHGICVHTWKKSWKYMHHNYIAFENF